MFSQGEERLGGKEDGNADDEDGGASGRVEHVASVLHVLTYS